MYTYIHTYIFRLFILLRFLYMTCIFKVMNTTDDVRSYVRALAPPFKSPAQARGKKTKVVLIIRKDACTLKYMF